MNIGKEIKVWEVELIPDSLPAAQPQEVPATPAQEPVPV